METGTIIWIVTGIAMVVGVVALISRAITNSSGKNSTMPKGHQYDTQDAPPSDSHSAGE
jgi:hypothetical protein